MKVKLNRKILTGMEDCLEVLVLYLKSSVSSEDPKQDNEVDDWVMTVKGGNSTSHSFTSFSTGLYLIVLGETFQ